MITNNNIAYQHGMDLGDYARGVINSHPNMSYEMDGDTIIINMGVSEEGEPFGYVDPGYSVIDAIQILTEQFEWKTVTTDNARALIEGYVDNFKANA